MRFDVGYLRFAIACLQVLAWPSIAGFSAKADETAWSVLPSRFTLSGIESHQRLVVEKVEHGRYMGQASDSIEFESSDSAVVFVDDGVAYPAGNGKATITAKRGDRAAVAQVEVRGLDEPFQWSFRNHVQSVFSKAGCNAGACHGAQAGKNGFKLSLRGYDPQGDFLTLTRRDRGRRVVPSDPARSLLLIKPSGAVAHGGGLRFDVDSREYRVVSEWIGAGTPRPSEEDPRLERLEILPEAVSLTAGAEQQFLVRAHFDDGHAEDVTSWVKYESTNLAVADVDDLGRVTVRGHGEGAITAWYLSRVIAATVTSPYALEAPKSLFAEAPRHNVIDELVLEKLERLNLPPSPPAGDGEFLRRAYLDTIGVLPTADEVRAFLADENPQKRAAVIEALLERDEFVDYWSYKWSDLLLVNSQKLPTPAMWSYYRWIRNNVAANTPWDEMAHRLITSVGSTLENGATNFFALHSDPRDLAETTSQAFLGMSIGCAKCHNHPLEKWTNDQYYGLANLFARVRAKDAPGEGHKIVFSAAQGDLTQPLRGRPQPPAALDGSALPLEAEGDRRAHLAEWLTSPENPYFSRAIVNRVWANFLGRGLVENIDDLRETNPPSNEALLDALADYLVAQDFDLRQLMRMILQSATYQRSSRPLPQNAEDERFYSRYYPRRLMGEVLLDAYSQVTAVATKLPGYPEGWRALQLPDANVASYFLKTFGRPERVITCECERTAEPSMVQVLHISNGDTLNEKLTSEGGRLAKLLAEGVSDEQLLDELYLNALARFPSERTKSEMLAVLNDVAPDERRAIVEDIFWSVLSSREFLFNH